MEQKYIFLKYGIQLLSVQQIVQKNQKHCTCLQQSFVSTMIKCSLNA